MSETETKPQAEGIPYKFECHKGISHRNIPADGTWVALNGHGRYVLNFYTDAPPLPKTIILETTKDGAKFTSKLPEIIYSADGGAIRQYEVSVMLSFDSVKFLHATLSDFIKAAEKASQPKTAS
jgi:hypothetical protein